ncbi:MAG: hypothetical protein H6Q65_1730 [Firmicutes bacterium]|nr:hypothetical protein [Bacillota bacterium]
MKNVYDEVQLFFDQEMDWEPFIQQETIEGFLRQKAWQGSSDKKLQEIWQNLRMFILYLAHSEHDNLDEITCREYSVIIEWLVGCVSGFKATLGAISYFFDVLLSFFRFLQNKKMVNNTEELESAIRLIPPGEKNEIVHSLFFEKNNPRLPSGVTEQVAGKKSLYWNAINNQELVSRLMGRLGSYFQNEDFSADFRRALLWYTGPYTKIPGQDQEDFWMGFWDYFLLDYRLLRNDKKALAHFHETHAKSLTFEEHHILSDMMNVRFVVFFVERILPQEKIQCVDLFSGEKFQLPCPDIDYKRMKKLLFYGHIFLQDSVLLNYMTSVEISTNLRRRIRQEVLRQKAMFSIQDPDASWRDFYNRHALLVRHTIEMLLTTAKVNVTPFEPLERKLPVITEACVPNVDVQKLIAQSIPKYGFSYHDERIAQKLWHDFSQLAGISVRKPKIWAATVLYVYSRLNSPHGIPTEDLARGFRISVASIYSNKKKMVDLLQLYPYDPRYLNEEGFIYLVYSS